MNQYKHKKVTIQSMFITILLSTSFIAAYQQKDISGSWKGINEKQEINIVIVLLQSGEYVGKSESKNRKQSVILRQIKYNPKRNNYTGIMIPPDADVELKATITLIDGDRIQLDAEKLVFRKRLILDRIK